METLNNILIMGQGNTIDAAEIFRAKYESKQNFIKAQNDVYSLFDKNILSHEVIQENCAKMDDCMEATMDAMDNLSDWYSNLKDYQKVNEVVVEMEEIEQEYAAIYEKMWRILKNKRCHSSVGTCAQNIKIDNNIVQTTTEQNKQQKPQSKLPEEFQNTGRFNRYLKTNIFLQRSSENKAHTASGFNLNGITSDSNSVAIEKSSSSTEGKRSISSERSTLRKTSASKSSRMVGKVSESEKKSQSVLRKKYGSKIMLESNKTSAVVAEVELGEVVESMVKFEDAAKIDVERKVTSEDMVEDLIRGQKQRKTRGRDRSRDRGGRLDSRGRVKVRYRGRCIGRSRGRVKVRYRGRCIGRCQVKGRCRRSGRCRVRITDRDRGRRIRSRVPPKSRDRGRRVGRSRGRIKSRDRNKRLRRQGGDRGCCLGVYRYWCQNRRSSPRGYWCQNRRSSPRGTSLRKCRRRISGQQRGQSRIQGRYGSLGKVEHRRRNRYLGAGRSLRRDSCREGPPKRFRSWMIPN